MSLNTSPLAVRLTIAHEPRASDGATFIRPRSPHFLKLRHWWLPPALVALALALIFVDPFAGDWDALDYTVLAQG